MGLQRMLGSALDKARAKRQERRNACQSPRGESESCPKRHNATINRPVLGVVARRASDEKWRSVRRCVAEEERRRSIRQHVTDLDQKHLRLDRKWDRLYGGYCRNKHKYDYLESELDRLWSDGAQVADSSSKFERELREELHMSLYEIDFRKAAVEATGAHMRYVLQCRQIMEGRYRRATPSEQMVCEEAEDQRHYSSDSDSDMAASQKRKYQDDEPDGTSERRKARKTLRTLGPPHEERFDARSDENSDAWSDEGLHRVLRVPMQRM